MRKESSQMYYQALWQETWSRPTRLIRGFATLVLCVVFLSTLMEIKNRPNNIQTNDYRVYLGFQDAGVTETLVERIHALEAQYDFTVQLCYYVGNEAGTVVYGLDEASFYGVERHAQSDAVFRVSNTLVPTDNDLHKDEIELQINGHTFACVGTAAYLEPEVTSVVPAPEQIETQDISLSVNPTLQQMPVIDVFASPDAKKQYETFLAAFQPSSIWMTLDGYALSGLPVHGVGFFLNTPLVGEERASFLATFDGVSYEEYVDQSLAARTRSSVVESLLEWQLYTSIRLTVIMTLLLFLQLVAWKIWILDFSKLINTCHLVGFSFVRQQMLILGYAGVIGLVAFGVGLAIERVISALVLQPMLNTAWSVKLGFIVLGIYLAALVLYTLYCLAVAVRRIGRREVTQ